MDQEATLELNAQDYQMRAGHAKHHKSSGVNGSTMDGDRGEHGPSYEDYESVESLGMHITDEIFDLQDQLGEFDYSKHEIPSLIELPHHTPYKDLHTGEIYEGQWKKGQK